MRYFVTGGAGFIGSNMVDALISRGPVTVYDNLSSGQLSFLARHEDNPDFTLIKGEVGDLESITRAMEGHDVVFHFASNPDIARGMRETYLDLKEGALLTYNVLEAMRLTGAQAILYASGSGIYGDVGSRATAEDFGPLLPISMYGAGKLAGEGLISAFCHMFDIRGYIFRFANVVGERQTHGVGYDFIRKLREDPRELKVLGDGSQSKSYIHVSDVVRAVLFIYEHAQDKVNIYNVATDDYINVKKIVEIAIAQMGLEDVRIDYSGGDRGWKGDVPVVRFNLDKIHKLGWRAEYNSEEAIKLSIQEMLN